mgnify:CR=1 FL=1
MLQRRGAGLVEGQPELIAVEQVDAVEGGVLRSGGDLVQDVVVLLHQVGPNQLRRRIHNRSTGGQTGEGLATPVAVPPTAPIVDEAASLVVVMLIAPVPSTVACRLLAASLAFKSLRDLTVPPVPSPKVMLVAVPLPVAPMVRVRPPSAVVPRCVQWCPPSGQAPSACRLCRR